MGRPASWRNPFVRQEKIMSKTLRNYLIAAVVVFVVALVVGVIGVQLTWGESAMLAAFLTVIGIGSYWWKYEGFG
jgi:heme O synthase-like polyprenyltransferase